MDNNLCEMLNIGRPGMCVTSLVYIGALHRGTESGGGGALKHNVVSRCDQENTVKGLFFEIKKSACAALVVVQTRQFSTKRVSFSKSLGFIWLHNSFRR